MEIEIFLEMGKESSMLILPILREKYSYNCNYRIPKVGQFGIMVYVENTQEAIRVLYRIEVELGL